MKKIDEEWEYLEVYYYSLGKCWKKEGLWRERERERVGIYYGLEWVGVYLVFIFIFMFCI